MNRNGSQDNLGWQAKTHEVKFTDSQLKAIQVLVESDKRSLKEVILKLCVDNAGVKIRYSEWASSYTVSYTFDKHHPNWGGHSFWLWCLDPEKGIKALSALVGEMYDELAMFSQQIHVNTAF